MKRPNKAEANSHTADGMGIVLIAGVTTTNSDEFPEIISTPPPFRPSGSFGSGRKKSDQGSGPRLVMVVPRGKYAPTGTSS